MAVDVARGGHVRRRGFSFDWQVVGVTVLPWALLLGLSPLESTTTPLILIGLLLGGPHILATVGLFAEPGLRDHVRTNRTAFVVVPLLVLVASIAAFALSPPRVVTGLLIGFLLWQTHHFTKQNLGMFVFWAKGRGLAGASATERKLVLATSAIGMTGILRTTTGGSWVATAMQAVGFVAIVGCAVAVLLGTSDARRRAALLVAVAFYAPLHVLDIGVVAAAASYASAHGAQYFLMVATATRPTVRSLTAFLAFFAVGATAIIAVALVDPRESGAWIIGLYKGLVAGHFLVDARFWRLRDAPVREFMRTRFSVL